MTNFGTLCHLPRRLHLLYPGVRVVNFCNVICPMHALQVRSKTKRIGYRGCTTNRTEDSR